MNYAFCLSSRFANMASFTPHLCKGVLNSSVRSPLHAVYFHKLSRGPMRTCLSELVSDGDLWAGTGGGGGAWAGSAGGSIAPGEIACRLYVPPGEEPF